MDEDGDISFGNDKVGLVKERFATSCGFPVSHVQLACCTSHCAYPCQGKELLVQSYTDAEMKPLKLIGHHGKISALAFGKAQDPLLLCSASDDYVLAWDIEHCYRRVREGMTATGLVIGTLLGRVEHLSLCATNNRVAACTGAKIYILSIKREEVLAVLGGHWGRLTAAEFCPWAADTLLSISEDRTFKVWDVGTQEILYQSAVLSASPLLSVFLSEKSRQLVTGSSDGQVWCFTLPDDHRCRLVTRLDLHKVEQRHPKHQEYAPDVTGRQLMSFYSGALHLEQTDSVETSKPVLRISPCSMPPDPSHVQERGGSCFWIGSSHSLYLIDLETSELCTALHLRDYPFLTISIAASWAIHQGDESKVFCLVSSPFDSIISLLEVQVPGLLKSQCSLQRNIFSADRKLSVVPSGPLLPKSPLNAELVKKEVPKPAKKTAPDVRVVKDHPITFHPRVKSSGYLTPPWMFTSKTNAQKKGQGLLKTRKKMGSFLADYPEDSAAPTVPHIQVSAAERSTPVCCLQFSGDGKQILCGLGNKSALLYKSSLTGPPVVYTGHDGAINSVGWSHSKQWVLTASEDRTLRVWPVGIIEPVLILGSEKFSKPPKCAQFYYLDKFLLLSSGPNLHLYLYHLDTVRDDIKRYNQKSLCKLTGKFGMISGTDITCASTINQFFSYMVLACGVDRSVAVFDMNAGRIAAEVPNAHTRAVHHIAQNQGSTYTTQALDSYSLFLTSAVTDGLKLWDLRTLRCVRRYESHVNRCHPCTAAFSPCGRFIATGSEDNCVYLYDVRSCTYLHKLQRHTETILNVTFNPSTPELLAGALDGKLQLFRPSNGATLT